MTDQQILTLALSIVIPISMLIYSNSRITDAKELLRAEIQAMRAEMRQGLDHLESLTAPKRESPGVCG